MDDAAATTHEAVFDVHEGGVWRRARDLAVGVVGAVVGDPQLVGGDLVVRRRDDHGELLRRKNLDEDEGAAMLAAMRRDLDTLTVAEFEARWAEVDDA
ncbi:hypothetical protein [Nocardioides marinquilinus]